MLGVLTPIQDAASGSQDLKAIVKSEGEFRDDLKVKILKGIRPFLPVKFCCRGGLVEVEVSPKDLVSSLPTEDHLEAHRLYSSSKEIHGYSCSYLHVSEGKLLTFLLYLPCLAKALSKV